MLSIENTSFETGLKCGAGSMYDSKWLEGEKLRDTMRTIANSNETFNTKYIHFNEFNERIGFDLDIYKPFTGASLAVWNPDGQIKPTSNEKKISSKTKKTDFAEGPKDFRVAIRIVSPYFMHR